MRNELKKIEQIEKYLEDKMSQEEKNSFEALLLINSELANELEHQKNLTERLALNAFKTDLLAYSFEGGVSSGSETNGKGFWTFGLIILGIITSIGLFFQFGNKKQQTENLEKEKSHFVKQISIDTVNEECEEDSILPSTFEKKPKYKKQDNLKRKAFKLPNKLKVPFQKVVIDSRKGDTIIMADSKSVVYIPANAIRNKNGKLVDGKVEIRYREFRETSDIVFSEIPMTYTENEEVLRFNSAGMFEIRAYKNGKELELIPEKPITLDYNITERMEDLNFYALNDDNQEWSYLNNLQMPPAKMPLTAQDTINDTSLIIKSIPSFKGGFGEFYNKITNHPLYISAVKYHLMGRCRFALEIDSSGKVENVIIYNKHANKFLIPDNEIGLIDTITTIIYKGLEGFTPPENLKVPLSLTQQYFIKGEVNYLKSLNRISKEKEHKRRNKETIGVDKEMAELRKIVLDYMSEDSLQKNFFLDIASVKTFKTEIEGETLISEMNFFENAKLGDTISFSLPNKNRTSINGFLSGNNEIFSKVMPGLRLNGFGVYNCDQVRRIKSPININASFYDKNEELIDANFLSVVDLTLNGAFSLPPNRFTINRKSPTVLFLTNDKNQIFTVSNKEIKSNVLRNGGSYSFEVIECTHDINSPKDLRKFLIQN